jgi:hypothetical protein
MTLKLSHNQNFDQSFHNQLEISFVGKKLLDYENQKFTTQNALREDLATFCYISFINNVE